MPLALRPRRFRCLAARALVRNFADRFDAAGARFATRRRTCRIRRRQRSLSSARRLAVVGDDERSRDLAERAETLASAHGFHQLMYRLENPVLVRAAGPFAPSPPNEIIAAVDELEGAELVGALAKVDSISSDRRWRSNSRCGRSCRPYRDWQSERSSETKSSERSVTRKRLTRKRRRQREEGGAAARRRDIERAPGWGREAERGTRSSSWSTSSSCSGTSSAGAGASPFHPCA